PLCSSRATSSRTSSTTGTRLRCLFRSACSTELPVRGGEIAAQVVNATQPMNELIVLASAAGGGGTCLAGEAHYIPLFYVLGPMASGRIARRIVHCIT